MFDVYITKETLQSLVKKKKRKFTKIYTLLPVTANTILYNQKFKFSRFYHHLAATAPN